MGIVFLLILLVGGLFVLNTFKDARVMPSKDCSDAPYGEPKIHKWIEKDPPDQHGYLICSKCGRLPGAP